MKLENMNNAYANKKCTNNIYINNRYTIEVTRKRIKNMYLRVKDTDGTLSVSAPYGMSDTEIRKFVESRMETLQETANQEQESQRTGGTRQQRASGRRSRETQNQEEQPREPVLETVEETAENTMSMGM